MPIRPAEDSNQYLHIDSNDQVLIVIPAFNEGNRVGAVVSQVREMGYKVLVVDDGSIDNTAAAAAAAGAEVISHPENRGKGAALDSGYRHARETGCKVLITMDGDGQHLPQDIPKFIEAYNRTKIPVIIGNRLLNEKDMPRIRRWTNHFMSWLLSRNMGQYVPDTQCGFRLFRSDVVPYVTTLTVRFEAESEILLHVAQRGIQMGWVRVSTVYGKGESKISPLRDAVRFFRMFFKYTGKRKVTQ